MQGPEATRNLEEKLENMRDDLLSKNRCNREEILQLELAVIKLQQDILMEVMRPIVTTQDNSGLQKKFEVYQSLLKDVQVNLQKSMEASKLASKRMLVFICLAIFAFFGVSLLNALEITK